MTPRALGLLTGLFWLTTSAGAPAAEATSSSPESLLEAACAKAFRAAGQAPPALDPALSRAALALARRAHREGAAAVTSGERIDREVSAAGGWDPSPRVIVARATGTGGHAVQAIASRTDLASLAATRLGVGYVAEDSEVAVLLLAQRKALLEPFPRQVAVGASLMLSGRLVLPFHDGQVVVSGPRGIRRSAPGPSDERNRFSARVDFPSPGLYTVEILAQSLKGPEVAALFQVQAGAASEPASPAAAAAEQPEAADLTRAQAQVLAAVNARRAAAGLKPLARSAALDVLATEHSEEMARLGYFAHVSPVQGDLWARLSKAGLTYRLIAENLGEARTALEAHRDIEASPGHLANVLDPRLELIGLGTARVRHGGLENVLLTEVFARAAP